MSDSKIHLPSVRCLKAFEASARHGSFTKAASELHTSQSSISRHIADLEDSLGVKLFVREKQRVSLSPQGAYLFRSVQNGLEKIQSGLKVVAEWGGG